MVVDDEAELVRLLALCHEHRTPVTFRAAGTSLSGQAVTDSVRVMLGEHWRGCRVGEGGGRSLCSLASSVQWPTSGWRRCSAMTPQDAAVAVHPVCSVRKMGTADKLGAIAARCSAQVITVDEVPCCGFAGDKGFHKPDLNATRCAT